MKLRATTYTFTAAAKTIDCALFTSLEAIQLITNVTDQIIIYNFADSTKGGTLASTTLTLEYDTTSMSDTDKLMVLVEDGTASTPINDGGNTITVDGTVAVTGVATSAKQDTGNTSIASVDTKTPSLGQALAAGSVPVVLTAAQISTLTPLSTVAVTQSGTWDEVGINDSGNSITVDNTVLSVVGSGTEATAQRVTIATDSTGVLSVDDNGGSLTIDGTITVGNPGDIGGGTQYTEGDTDATITGTAAMVEGAANALAVMTQPLTDTQIRATALPVSGTVTANLSATDNAVLDAIEADTTTLAGAVSGTEMQVDVLTMPTVTVTATNLDVQSGGADLATSTQAGAIQTSVELIDDTVYTDGTGTVTKGIAILGQDGTNPQAIKTDASGELQVDVLSMPTTAVTGTFWQATQPVSLTSTTITGTVAVTQSGTWDEVGINDSGNSITVDYATTGSGTATGALRVELPTNGTGVIATVGAVTAITNALPAGTNAIGKLSTNSGVDIGDVDILSIAAGSNLVGDVSLQPRTANGCTIFRSLDLDETEEEIKATAGNVYGYYFYNKAATAMYLKFYNATAANVTVGTTTPVLTMGLPAGAAGHVGLPYAPSFGTAITAAVTTGIADADTGAPAANDVSINVFYK